MAPTQDLVVNEFFDPSCQPASEGHPLQRREYNTRSVGCHGSLQGILGLQVRSHQHLEQNRQTHQGTESWPKACCFIRSKCSRRRSGFLPANPLAKQQTSSFPACQLQRQGPQGLLGCLIPQDLGTFPELPARPDNDLERRIMVVRVFGTERCPNTRITVRLILNTSQQLSTTVVED
jgi:hypothetical protein